MNITVEINNQCDSWRKYREINEEFFSKTIENILSRYPNFAKVKNIELSVLLTDDNEMMSLNDQFRSKKKATNVLSFQDLEINWRQIVEFSPDEDYIYLGDVAFGYDYIEKEAEKKSIIFLDHFQHLLIHAILHLIGYDHNDEEEAKIMENLETQILETFGINSPY